MPRKASPSSLEIRIAGEGISPRDVPIAELARLLSAASVLLRTLAEERKIAAPEVALVALTEGSVALKLAPSDPEADSEFAALVECTHAAVRSRGDGYSPRVKGALERLYTACSRGPLQISGTADRKILGSVLMAQPLRVVADRIESSRIFHGRVEGVSLVRERFEIAFKPADGSGKLTLQTEKTGLAERAARLFNRNARIKARFSRSADGRRDDWMLVQIGSWEPSNLIDVMTEIGANLSAEGFDVRSDRFEAAIRDSREPE